MDENEFDEIITEALLPEDRGLFSINDISVFINGNICNVNFTVSIKDIIDTLEERVKRLEEKHGQDEGST